jgi:hypothetical protein
MESPGLLGSLHPAGGGADLVVGTPASAIANSSPDEWVVSAARHEAAHVIAALHYDRQVGDVSADPEGGLASVGLIADDADPDRITLAFVVEDIVILLAGAEVDRRSLGPTGDSAADRERAYATATRFTDNVDEANALIGFASARCRTLASNPGFVAAVERLASRVAADGELDADEIIATINPHNEETSNGTE